MGSPRAITNVTGQVASRHDYLPFGEEVMAGTGGRTTAQGYGANDKIRQQFTGYERDVESGLDYAQARYFASKHGRFTSVDPLTASASIKNPQTLNRYSYGLNSPYKFVDPTGLAGSDISCGGNSSGGGQGSTLGSCESERSLERYNQRVENTLDAAAVNRAVADNDQATAESICAGNANITCNRARGTNVAVTILPDGPNDDMSISNDALDLLKKTEGLPGSNGQPALTSYDKDGAKTGNCTIGWGQLLNTGPCKGDNKGKTTTEPEASAVLGVNILETEANIKSQITVKLSQQQFDALVILAFNLRGKSLSTTPKLRAAINNPNLRDRDAVIRKEWSNINKSGGTVVQGLTNRRNAELNVFFDGVYKMW